MVEISHERHALARVDLALPTKMCGMGHHVKRWDVDLRRPVRDRCSVGKFTAQFQIFEVTEMGLVQ
jgi:hypothetical protein